MSKLKQMSVKMTMIAWSKILEEKTSGYSILQLITTCCPNQLPKCSMKYLVMVIPSRVKMDLNLSLPYTDLLLMTSVYVINSSCV